MNALWSMMAWDVRLQARYGFYAVYTLLTATFILGLRALGPAVRTDAAVLLIVTDPTVLGFYFIAAMVLYEKEAGVLDALVTSPLGDRGYLASKVVTLSALATLAATLVAVVGHGSPTGLGLLLLGVPLSASLFVLVGFVAVARYDSINEYFISAVGWGTVLFLPLAGYVGVVDSPLFYLLPAQPVLLVVEGGFRPLAAWQIVYSLGYLLVANGVAGLLARRSFRRHVVRGGDPGPQLGRGEPPGAIHSADREPNPSRFRWTGLVLSDLRNWVRDPMLAVAAVGPLALAVVVRVAAPVVTELAAPAFDLRQSYPIVAGAMVVFAPALYGFVVGMFVLEDRDQGVLSAYRTSPLSAGGYLRYRGATAYVLSLLATLPALAVVGLVSVPVPVLVGSVAVGALGGPTIALAFGTIASDSIEGIALSKVLNLFVLGPVVVLAVVPEPIQFVAGVIPTYWPVKAFVAGAAGDPTWPLSLVFGAVTHGLALVGLVRWFSRQAQ